MGNAHNSSGAPDRVQGNPAPGADFTISLDRECRSLLEFFN